MCNYHKDNMKPSLISKSKDTVQTFLQLIPYRKILAIAKRKWIFLFILPALIFSFYSCGLIDSNGGNNPQKIVVVNKIYTMNTDGTNIKFLAYGNKAQFSPDGNKIFFGNLNSINIDGTGLQQLIPQNLSVWDYNISNDGKIITFSTFYELYVMNIDGSGLIKLISRDTNFDFSTNESISPNDSLIAYQYNFEIGIMNSDGTNRKTLLVSDSANKYFNPVFTPDGNNLLFIRRDYYDDWYIIEYNLKTAASYYVLTGQPSDGITVLPDNLALFSANNSIQTLDIATHKDIILTDGYQESPSKDLSKIIYTKPKDPQKAVYIYDIGTRNITTLKPGFQWAVIQYPKFSPDGKQILFEADSTYIDGYLFQ